MKYNPTLLFTVSVFLFAKVEGQDRKYSSLTKEDVKKAKTHIRSFIEKTITDIPEPHLKLIPGFIRLAFHDCSGQNCDGCLNPENRFNRRVVPNIKIVEELYTNTYQGGFRIINVMSRADFWALGSIVATEMGIKLNNQRCKKEKDCIIPHMDLPFKYGRKECETSPLYDPIFYSTPVLPPPFLNNSETMRFFRINYGFNDEETTVIMAGHSVGFSDGNISIQPGTWEVGNVDGLGNKFFKNMLDTKLNWHQVIHKTSKDEDRYSWNGVGQAFGIDTDINLVRDISVNRTTGQATEYCKSPISKTHKYVQKMTNPQYFSSKYAQTFIKMISASNVELRFPS